MSSKSNNSPANSEIDLHDAIDVVSPSQLIRSPFTYSYDKVASMPHTSGSHVYGGAVHF